MEPKVIEQSPKLESRINEVRGNFDTTPGPLVRSGKIWGVLLKIQGNSKKVRELPGRPGDF
jgi:hypothetical protein